MKRIFWPVAGLLSLAACHSQTSQTTPADTPEASQPPASSPAAVGSPGTAYQVYRGLLPGQVDSITLHLVTAPRSFNEVTGRFGSYYGADGHPYTLQGQPSAAPDSVLLLETSLEKTADGHDTTWRLRRQPGRGDLVGMVAGRPLHLRLAPTAAGALSFVVRYFADSAAAFPQEAKSPVGHISLQALVPVGGAPAPREALATNIVRGLRGDTVAAQAVPALARLYQQQRQQFVQAYREDAASTRPAPADTAGIGPYGPGLSYQDQSATYVLYQQGSLLSLGFFHYSFSGGAHGNYGTAGVSYDLRTGQPLGYDAIFLPTAAARLPALLAQAVRPLVGLRPGEPLDKELLVQQMPVTHNVFLTAGGVVFVYQPYEIASYAQGEVRIFVPLATLRPLLRPGLPLPEASGLAAR